MSRTVSRAAALVAVGVLLALPGCDAGDEPGSDELRVVATTSVLGDVVRNLVPEGVEVAVLMPAGTDPHGFQASAAQARIVREADLVVANGLGLEEGLLDLLDDVAGEGIPVLELAPQLDPQPFLLDPRGEPDGHDGHEDEHGHDADALDPHVWTDPLRMADGARIVARRLAEVDPAGRDGWAERGQAYADELRALHQVLSGLVGDVPADDRKLVTDHDSLGYFARRYGFEMVAAILPGGSTLSEASARDFAALVETVEAAGVPAVFVEATASPRLARRLAAAVGRPIEVVELFAGSLGPEGSGGETYASMLRTDTQRIVDALG